MSGARSRLRARLTPGALLCVSGVAVALLTASCSVGRNPVGSHGSSPEYGTSSGNGEVVRVARGVHYRAIPENDPLTNGSPVWLVEAELGIPGPVIRVVSSGLRERESPRYGDCHVAALWCATTGAVAAINGGYFGDGDDKRKEIVGLLVGDRMVLSSGSQRRGSRGPYVRSVFGVGLDGSPGIRWATGRRGSKADLQWYSDPEQSQASGTWSVREAVGCGPTLVVGGKVRVTDRQERLVSPGRLPRTFIGYSSRSGKPDRLVMAVGQAMEYSDAAAFMAGYFRRELKTECERAMCLDGGASSQIACVADGNVVEPYAAYVKVPTAVAIKARVDGSGGGSE